MHPLTRTGHGILAIDLNSPGSYVHWSIFTVSVANLVLIAVMWHDFTPTEVAELLGVPAGRVRVHLFRALKLVEKELSGP